MNARAGSMLVLGLGLGFAGAQALVACCPEPKDVVWDVSPGTYAINDRYGAQPLHGDTSYSLVVAPDGNSAVESYVRAGKVFRTEYAIGPGTESLLRSDDNLGSE